jgi:hypothetical protein
MSTPTNFGKDTGAAKARLAAMEATRARLRAEREEEEKRLEAEIAAEAEKVEEEERLAEERRQAEIEQRRKTELDRRRALEERRLRVEADQKGSEVEYLSGPSKKRKLEVSVSNKLDKLKGVLIQQ